MQSTSNTSPVYESPGHGLQRVPTDHRSMGLGPVVSARRPNLEVAASPHPAESAAAQGFDLCRLLVALLGVGVYLGVPASLIALAVRQLAI